MNSVSTLSVPLLEICLNRAALFTFHNFLTVFSLQNGTVDALQCSNTAAEVYKFTEYCS